MLHLHGARADEGVDARPLGDLDCVPAHADVLLDGPRQPGDARPRDLRGDRLDGLEVVWRGDREPGLDGVDAQPRELAGDLELLAPIQRGARGLLTVAQSGVEDVDVAMRTHEVPTPPKAGVVAADVAQGPDGVRNGALRAGRCLRFPPRGEKEEGAREGEHAGAYLNVVLPACAATTHRLASVSKPSPKVQACAWDGRTHARNPSSPSQAPLPRAASADGGRGRDSTRHGRRYSAQRMTRRPDPAICCWVPSGSVA